MNKAEYDAMPENEKFNRVLEGTAYYTCAHKPNLSGQKKYGSLPEYVVTLGLDKKNEKLATSWGLMVKEATDAIPEPHIKVKRKVKEGIDPETVKPDVLDGMQKPIPESVLIGNGSKIRVKFATYWPGNGEIYGAQTVWFKMVVDDLVVYDRSNIVDSDLGIKEGGFSIEEHMKTNDEVGLPPSEDTMDDEAPAKGEKVASGGIFDE